MNNQDLANQLERTGLLVRLGGGNDFKAAAWDRAARALEHLEQPIADLIAEKRIESIGGIGKSIAKEIYAWGETGSLPRLELLRSEIPEGLLEWLNISGLGPKKSYKIHSELGITTIAELKEKCRDGSVAQLSGMGAKSAEKILKSIAWMEQHNERCLIAEAEAIADHFQQALQGQPGVQQLAVAGSLRRRLETIGDIDLLLAADAADAAPVFETFTRLPEVLEVLGQGDTKGSVRTRTGRQVDLRIVQPAQFPAALMYFTGSKEHNVELRSRARKRGMALNEYGLFRLDDEGNTDFDQPLDYTSEADLYRLLGLHHIPPELREGNEGIAWFEHHETADLVTAGDLRGILHAHSTWSDGRDSIEAMARACIDRGYHYLGLTDHSRSSVYANGLSIDRLKAQWDEIDVLNQRLADEGHTFKVFKGIECDILVDGALDYPDDVLQKFDFIIGSVHAALEQPPEKMLARFKRAVEHPLCRMIGHPTGRKLLQRAGNAFDLSELIAHAAEHSTVIEINANPKRLDIDWRHGPAMRAHHLLSAINPDAHNTEAIDFVRFGVDTARKAWLPKQQILNCLDLAAFEAWIQEAPT